MCVRSPCVFQCFALTLCLPSDIGRDPHPCRCASVCRAERSSMPTPGGPGEPTTPVPGVLCTPRAESRIGEGRPLVPHLGWYDDLSTPYACARQRCVSDPSHIHVAPLNTYPFLNEVCAWCGTQAAVLIRFPLKCGRLRNRYVQKFYMFFTFAHVSPTPYSYRGAGSFSRKSCVVFT